MKAMLAVLLCLLLCGAAAEEGWEEAVVVNCEEWVSLREEPDTSSGRLKQVPLGRTVLARAFDEDFALCRYEGLEGYILNEYLDAAYSADTVSGAGVLVPNVEEFLSLRVSPSASASVIRRVLPGEEMTVLGWSGKFARVRIGADEGYVHTGYTAARNGDLSRWPYDYDALLRDVGGLGDSVVCESIGVSADGREIPVLRFGTGDIHILIQAGIHGREIMSGRLAMDLLAELVGKHPGGVEGVTFHVIPMANPDGVVVAVRGPEGLRDAGLRRQVQEMLAGEGVGHERWKANARGVDLNRNFDAGWDALTGRAPGSSRYRGPSAMSEPETAALAAYTRRYDFALTVSYHSYGSLIYREGARDAGLRGRTEELARLIGNHAGYPLSRSESASTERGGYKDWALEALDIPSITVEIGALNSTGSVQEYTGILLRHSGSWEKLADWAK